jgi:hypothetical protein
MAVKLPSNHAGDDAGADSSMAQAFSQAQQTESERFSSQTGAAEARERPAGPGSHFAFSSSTHFFQTVLPANSESEVLTKIHDMLKARFVSSSPEHELTLVPVNRDDTMQLEFSVMVVALRHKSWPERGVAYYTMILEGSAPELQPILRSEGGETFDDLRFPSDMNTAALDAEVRERLTRVFPQHPLWSAGVGVVQRDFNPENKELAHRLAKCVSDACVLEIERRAPGGFRDLNLVEAVGNDQLVIRPTFGNGQVYDVMGNPVRGDIEIRTTIPGKPVPGQLELTTRETVVSVVHGFVDLVWSPEEAQILPYMQTPAVTTVNSALRRKYYPRFVITNCGSDKVPTLGGQLLSIMAATACLSPGLWVEAFRPTQSRASGNEVNWRNIGALNIEANLENDPSGYGTPLNSMLDSFTRETGPNGSQFRTLIANTIREKLVVSMDIVECGIESYLSEVLYLAAEGNSSNSRPANIQIIQSMEDLTDGHFLPIWNRLWQQANPKLSLRPEDRRLVTDECNRILKGTLVYGGELMSTDYVDYLANLNVAGPNNHEDVLAWSDTFSNVGIKLNQRVAKRSKIAKGIAGPATRFTAAARRVTLASDVLAAGLMALGELKLNMVFQSAGLGRPQYQRAINPFLDAAALDPNVNAGFFGSGFGTPSAQYGNRAGFNRFMS